MARKPLSEQRAQKLAELIRLKQDIARMEDKAAARLGKLALRAGLADLDLNDADLLKEFYTLAARFRGREEVEASKKERANAAAATYVEATCHGH
jgi:hypothetical protein